MININTLGASSTEVTWTYDPWEYDYYPYQPYQTVYYPVYYPIYPNLILAPLTNFKEEFEDGKYTLSTDLPGWSKEDICVKIDGINTDVKYLVVQGLKINRSNNNSTEMSFSTSFKLPSYLDCTKDPTCTFINGKLTLKFDQITLKSDECKQTKKIDIQ